MYNGVPMSSCENLTSLTWVGVRDETDFGDLSRIFQERSHQFRQIKLNAANSRDPLYVDHVLAHSILPDNGSGPLFSSLQALSLEYTPIGDSFEELVNVLNWEILRSLKLIECTGWDAFLLEVLHSKRPMNLTQFEFALYYIDDEDVDVVTTFLASFKGLQDLFIFVGSHEEPIDVWRSFLFHRETLKRLYYNGCALEEFPHNAGEFDGYVRSIPFLCGAPQNPFLEVDLAFLGVSAIGCKDYYLV